MRKNWKFAMACLLAGAMITPNLNVQAAKTNADQMQKASVQASQRAKSNLNISDYIVDGEVVIMYGDKNKKVSAMSANSLGKDMVVEETVVFDFDDKANAKNGGSTGNICISRVSSDKLSVAEMINLLKKNKDITSVQPNIKLHATTTDYSSFQWALDNQGQNGGIEGFDMNPEVAIAKDSKDTKEKVIAIVDTGVDYSHSDLADKMWENPYSASKLKGKYGYDFVNMDTDPLDDNGHGTHCAGISAGNVDESGISGVSDSDNIKVMALKFLDAEGGGNLMDAVNAYNYIYRAQKLGTNVVAINNSWGAAFPEELLEMFGLTLDDMIPERGVMNQLISMVGEMGAISCIAAGNDATNTEEMYFYPANLDSPYKITVAACNENGELASFSNYSERLVDLAAPGVDILSSVSYDNYNPVIYSEEKLAETTSYINDFEKKNSLDIFNSKDVRKIENMGDEISLTDEYHFGNGSKALSIKLDELKSGQQYVWCVPIEVPEGEGEYYVSADVKLNSDSEESYAEFDVQNLSEDCDIAQVYFSEEAFFGSGNYWSHKLVQLSDEETEGTKTYAMLSFTNYGASSVEIILDNLAVSKRVEDTSIFEKYAFYNGTSMATPYVAGAVAELSQVYPEMTALEKKNLMMSCCRKTEGLAYTCKTGGMLDLGMIESPSMRVAGISLDANKNIVINGSFVNGATVYLDGEEVEPSSKSDECLVVPYKGKKNVAVDVEIVKGEDEYYDSVFVPKAEIMKNTKIAPLESYCSSFTSDANDTYMVRNYGAAIDKINETKDGMTVTPVVAECLPNVFGEDYATFVGGAVFLDGDVAVCNGKFYGLLSLDAGFCGEMILAGATPNGTWEKLADVPEEIKDLEGVSVAAYNGNIYVLGGFNEEERVFSKAVYVFDTKTGKFDKAADLPKARAFSKAVQVGNKLVVTLGATDLDETFPKNVIFDGKNWTTSTKKLDCYTNDMYYFETEQPQGGEDQPMGSFKKRYVKNDGADGNIEDNDNDASEDEDEDYGLWYYDANVVLIDGGLAYEGLFVNGLGNMFAYNVAKDAFEETSYAAPNFSYDDVQGMSVNGDTIQLYALGIDTLTKYEAKQKNGYVNATVNATNATVDGVKTWLPCDQINISAKANKDCYIESMTVNSKAVTANDKKEYVVSANASDYVDGLTINVKATPYITSIQLDEKIDILAGSEAKLTAIVLPDTITNAKLKWESSDSTVATVDENGVVKVPATAKARSVATITVTATDRGTVKASCKVTVTEKVVPVPAKGTKKTVGKFVYKVTKSDKTAGTVSVVKMTNKNFTTISIPATVNIDGYTFKVTSIAANAFKSSKKLTTVTIGKNVTSIGKNAFKSSKKLKKVTIKATKIKTIGKGAFTSVNKKCAIKVPKKQKKAYKSLLKKSGYKYKVK